MEDAANNVSEPVAPASDSTPSEQGGTPASVPETPAETPSDKGEKLLGKFNSVEELANSYKELESKFTQSQQQRSAETREQAPVDPAGYQPSQIPNAYGNELPFDQETLTGLDQWYERRRENERAAEFVTKHREELSDPILAGTTQRLIQEANRKGERIDQETALAEAKKLLDSRLKPAEAQAKDEGFKEGEEVTRKRELAGAVGGTGTTAPKVDPNSLSAKEYAEYHGLPRI